MKKGFILLVLLFPALFLMAGEGPDLSGPLYGKNYYLPHLPVYSFPGFSPRSGQRGAMSASFSYTGINEFAAYDELTTALDYESSIFEGNYTWRYDDNLLLGADLRFISYYGGFMDSAVELWHSLFNFPNAGRELFSQNDLMINIDNRSGRNILIHDPILTFGDTDLYGVWTFYEDQKFNLALSGAIKLPTGSLVKGTGSGFIDLGIQILGEWIISPQWSLHLQQGFVLPGDVLVYSEDSYASAFSSQTFGAIQFCPRSDWAILAQMRVNTSPIDSDRERIYSGFGTISFFTLPVTTLQVGVKKTFTQWVGQFYIEEDPITYEGADILFNLKLSYFF